MVESLKAILSDGTIFLCPQVDLRHNTEMNTRKINILLFRFLILLHISVIIRSHFNLYFVHKRNKLYNYTNF